jgi:hypothetical protein
MVNKYQERFTETAIKVAAHISTWDDKSPRIESINFVKNGVWIKKNRLATNTFFRHLKYLEKNHAWIKTPNLINFPSLDSHDAPKGEPIRPWLPKDFEHPIYDDAYLAEIFTEFLMDYQPPKQDYNDTSDNLVMHLWAMQLYFSRILLYVKNVSMETLGLIDYAFSLLLIPTAGLFFGRTFDKEQRQNRISNTTETRRLDSQGKKDKILRILNSPKHSPHKGYKKHYTAASQMLDNWLKVFPEDKGNEKAIPSKRFIADYLKTLK